MKLFSILILFALITGIVSCKKETTDPAPQFSPVGYWRGNAAHFHTAILNHADGKSRIYYRIFGLDTAGAMIGDGSYTVTGNTFKATYQINNSTIMFFVDAYLDNAGMFNGVVYNSISPDILACIFRKQ